MKKFITHVTIWTFLASAAGPVAGGQTGAPTGAATRTAAAATDATVDGGWPRAYTAASGVQIVLYQPQIASWPDQKHMTIYAAVSYQPKDSKTPALGALKIESDTSVAVEDRLVNFSQFTVTEASFPQTPRDQVKAIVDEIIATVPRDQRVIALDRVLAMVDTSQVSPRNMEGVKADPPPIFFSATPAVLVNLDGPPIWS